MKYFRNFYAFRTVNRCWVFFFHIRTVHLDIIKVVFIHQVMHQWVVLKNNIEIYIKIYIKTAPTCFGVTVTASSGSALINAHPEDGVTVTSKPVGAD